MKGKGEPRTSGSGGKAERRRGGDKARWKFVGFLRDGFDSFMDKRFMNTVICTVFSLGKFKV